jgi:hypothetical protein
MKFPIWSVFCAMLLAVFYVKDHARNKQTTIILEVGSLAPQVADEAEELVSRLCYTSRGYGCLAVRNTQSWLHEVINYFMCFPQQ